MNNYEAIRAAAEREISGEMPEGVRIIRGGEGLDALNAMRTGSSDVTGPAEGYRPVPGGKGFTIGSFKAGVLTAQASVEIAQVGGGAEIYLDNLFVDAEFRGRGEARLLAAAISEVLGRVAISAEGLKPGASGHISPVIEGARGEAGSKIAWKISDALSAAIDEAAPEVSDFWA